MDSNSAVARLRDATRASHDAVDAAFGGYDLSNRDDYRRFLGAHARALPAAEQALGALAFARTLPPRTPLLEQDLADLGEQMPGSLSFACADEAALWGALYVVEGSRLGGVMLSRSVGSDLPHRYLAAAHGPGQWRAIRDAIDAAGRDASTEWYDALLNGAAATFDLYAQAARVGEPALAPV
ncbi:biliverdin-producing heme oxygenase [uncultured Sphingomonas sp.]|uniref:biliverdin-producing heme oxygenase n=1 Tax=uncultured Sphingomonas sp. TaxID=158754 RepID=UPI0025EDCBFC|nr:biliverdin-producing heme oxygenase [uncultured Sphingomonas sp.]